MKRLAAVGLLAIAAAGLLFASVLHRYRPLENGSLSRGVIVEHVDPNPLTRADLRDIAPNFSPDEVEIRFRPGGRFLHGFSVQNGGRWPITITKIPLPSEGLAIGERIRMGVSNDFSGSPPMVAFHPFRLAPGQERYVEADYRLVECGKTPGENGATLWGWNTQRIDYEVFGISRHMDFELPQGIAILYSLQGVPPGCGLNRNGVDSTR